MKFVAYDGKVFDTMEECKRHEENLIRFYDFNGEQILPDLDDLHPIDYIYCGSLDALQEYDEKKGTGFRDSICSEGLWYWDDDDGEWEDFDEELKRLKFMVSRMENIEKKIKGL